MSAPFPELNLRLNARRWACVLDPSLALSPQGLGLARQMGEVMQLWLVREFWHILDSSEFLAAHPEALTGELGPIDKLPQSLRDWDRARMETDMAGLKLWWIGDGPSESVLPEGTDPRLLQGYEALAWALSRRIPAARPMSSAMRDAAALAAALGHGLVLSLGPRGTLPLPPICHALQTWDVPCRCVDASDPMAAMESQHLRELLVHAGLAQHMWAGLQLSVVRLLLPNAQFPLPAPPAFDDALADEGEPARPDDVPAPDPWASAQAFWHLV
jgi:hypothetical protein